ncbi:NAD(P)-dependent dehydrogenase, short-chain alcohol dehydrogenase family [Algoriphagus faecimaris]|uniref:NAD(P)-dependent dehydrogenase, short-chain alcohol dehydrogenase family n=1 Tax=Algoriphagus faecimaris TaxID=686796 RepID=A0A1G6WYP3_9BACT|nr:SDR family oxidoreductase [Algoriphagus faecimaris]SDD70961.1 NAD(P)-dependent dehydrogenase, short-chain alcohol dehydrogenase family [Algoriphagus faecimaris]
MKDKTILITGGASGIGAAMVRKFANENSRVYFIDTNELAAQQLINVLKAKGHEAQFLHGDITDFVALQKLIEQIPSKLDVLINNAGVSHIGKVENTSEEDFDRIFQVNIKGIFNCTKATLPSLIADGGGSILNMCSVAATIGIPDRFAYSMSKGAALSMTLSIARDYVDQNIRCNCISPGRVHTPFVDDFLSKNYPGKEKEMFEKLAATQPIGRMGTPEEIAEMAYFISSESGSFITGANFTVDGGFMGLKM